jgi:hypothetical protein
LGEQLRLIAFEMGEEVSFPALVSQRASYIGAIQADQTVESDHSDLLVQWGTRLPGHVLLQLDLANWYSIDKTIDSSI